MDTSMNFRNALNGFNRTDVVQFIQKQTADHEKEMRLLREENARLQEALDVARAEAEEAKSAMSSMIAASSNLDAFPSVDSIPVAEEEAPAEESAPAPAPVLDTPIAPAATVVAPAPSDFNEMELAAYRRAEMTERMARERAAASANRMKAVFSQADEKLSLTSQDMSTLMDTFRADFEKLEQLLSTAQGIVDESSSGLKAASDICNEP